MSTATTVTRAPHGHVIPASIMAAFPGCTESEIQYEMEMAILRSGSFEKAVRNYEAQCAVLARGVVIGATLPRPGIQLKSVTFDYIQIFYHPTWPAPHPAGNPFTWSFYVGRANRGPEHCIADWKQHGIAVHALGFRDEWQEACSLVVIPCTRVQITYPSSNGVGSSTHELVFPRHPSITSPVHHLDPYVAIV